MLLSWTSGGRGRPALSLLAFLSGLLAGAAEAQTFRAGVREPPQSRQDNRKAQMPCFGLGPPANWSLEGTLLTPNQVIQHGTITIAQTKIAGVEQAKSDPSFCSAKVDGIILPGFVDLHNHLTWNIFPRWVPTQHYSNRDEWRETDDYKQFLQDPYDDLVTTSPYLGCEANLYGEVKAIVGGATSSVGSLGHACVAGLVRNLDFESGLASTRRGPIGTCVGHMSDNPIVDVSVNEVRPLDLPAQRVKYLKCHLTSGRLRSLLVHLAEGAPGDIPSQEEFDQLQDLGLVQEGLVIIHGTALNPKQLAAVKSSGAGLVWSPRSNMELYDGTLNIRAAQKAGVSIAIAPDWSPTGSDGMLQELNYAHTNFSAFNAEQLTTMATAIPARLARLDNQIGQLKPGLFADLLVIRRKAGSAYESVVTASPADVQLVVINGRPVYGDRALMQQLVPNKKLVALSVCGVSKAIDLGGTHAAQSSWETLTDALQDGLHQGAHPTELSALACPEASPTRVPRRPSPRPVHVPGVDPGPSPMEQTVRPQERANN